MGTILGEGIWLVDTEVSSARLRCVIVFKKKNGINKSAKITKKKKSINKSAKFSSCLKNLLLSMSSPATTVSK